MKKTVVIGIALLLALFIYYTYNPNNYAYFPKCPFLQITGYQCPGCGSQRAIHHLLHFNLIGAWRENPLLILSIPYVFGLVIAERKREKDNSKLYTYLHRPIFLWSYFIVVVAWWVGRNLL